VHDQLWAVRLDDRRSARRAKHVRQVSTHLQTAKDASGTRQNCSKLYQAAARQACASLHMQSAKDAWRTM
jgi:hypothetical protein